MGVANQAASPGAWQQQREWLRARIDLAVPNGIGAEEIEAHFAAMPADYWERVTEADVMWGLETIHGFLKLISAPRIAPTTPFVNWRHCPESSRTRVLLCTWDRRGLLAKAAAAFSAVRINILQANVFTRADNIVMDEFCVADADGQPTVSDARLEQMRFLLEGALSEPPRFASVWACSRHKFLAPPTLIAPQISFDNESLPDRTLVRVDAVDRLGLLYDLLQAIADEGLSVKQARIETEGNMARDVIHVTSAGAEQKLGGEELEILRARLKAALTLSDAAPLSQNCWGSRQLQTH